MAMKETIQTMLKNTKENTKGNIKYIDEGFRQFLGTSSWNEVARNLKEFEYNDPKFFHLSRKAVITKINDIFRTFDNNMKTLNGFEENIGLLDSYKAIGLCFSTFTYDNNDDNDNQIVIPHIESTLKRMYKDIEARFINKCKEIKSSLNGHKPFKCLKENFFIIIKVLENKDKLPQKFAKRIMNACDQLYQPIQKLVNILKTRKYKGLDKNSNDIDPLVDALNQLKELNEVDFHSNIRKLVPFMESMDEKQNKINFTSENISKLENDIDNIEYDLTVKETKDMLTEYKDNISKEGLNKNIIQRNQAKRLSYLKNVAMKCKSLVKSMWHVCVQHLDIPQQEFKRTFIKPCTKRMGKDILSMQRETNDAFNKEKLNVKDLQRANANMEAFYAVKNVFERELDDDQLCAEIQVEKAINKCEETATERVKQLSEEIQVQGLNNENVGQHIEKCAENLMNLEYLNQHMNFKTSINENVSSENDLHQEVQHAIKATMNHLTKKKVNFNKLYSHLLDKDANYGVVFSQQHKGFKQSLNAAAMSKKFRELDISAIIENLKETEKEMKQQNLHVTNMVGVDYEKITDTFNKISKKYEELVMANLTAAKSFEQLTQEQIPTLANDAKVMARQALNSKESLLNQMYNNGVNLFKTSVSWFTSSNNSGANDPRDCYWTGDMRQAVPELIPYILAVWTLSNASCYYEADDDSKNTLMRARNAQIVAICCILCLDIDLTQKKLINNLVEVGTGEGKSVIMAITAIILALLDFDVYCACYSELLSKRDQKAFNELFNKYA
eukprot:190456_1